MRTALSLLFIALLATACGSKESGGAAEPTPPDTTDATPVAPAANGNDGEAQTPPPAADPALIAKGAAIYEDACSTCHGDDGAGGKKSPAIKGAGSLSKFPSDDALFEYTKKEMPKDDPGGLSDDDYKAVIAWMRS